MGCPKHREGQKSVDGHPFLWSFGKRRASAALLHLSGVIVRICLFTNMEIVKSWRRARMQAANLGTEPRAALPPPQVCAVCRNCRACRPGPHWPVHQSLFCRWAGCQIRPKQLVPDWSTPTPSTIKAGQTQGEPQFE